jgi:hypothetical protein
MSDRTIRRFSRLPQAGGLAVLAALGGGMLTAAAQEAGAAPDNAIVASLNDVPQGLSCSDAAAQAHVSFDFQKPDFDIKQISLYVDGHGVAGDAVTQQWPRVTLSSGLHPGRNTVEIVATGDGDRSVARQLTVLIGVPPKNGDESAASVQCDDSRTQVASTPPPAVEDQGDQEAQTVEPPPQVINRTVYVDQPVYVYHDIPAYPVWPLFVPIIPIVIGSFPPPVWYVSRPYCPPPRVAYYPAPPVYAAPPVTYRQPPHMPPPTSNLYRTPQYNGVPQPLHGTPMPLTGNGVARAAPVGHSYNAQWQPQQPAADPRWGAVTQMNPGGNNTRYRTPAPPERSSMPPHASSQPQWGGEPPRQTYVHEAPEPHFDMPRPMSPPRMNSAPAFHQQPQMQMPAAHMPSMHMPMQGFGQHH